MKAHEAVYAWNPKAYDFEQDYCRRRGMVAGNVKVGPLPHLSSEPNWTQPFMSTGGAVFADTQKLRGVKSILKLFIDFHTLVVRDGIDPKEAHKAFLAIDEYAEMISPDIKGAR